MQQPCSLASLNLCFRLERTVPPSRVSTKPRAQGQGHQEHSCFSEQLPKGLAQRPPPSPRLGAKVRLGWARALPTQPGLPAPEIEIRACQDPPQSPPASPAACFPPGSPHCPSRITLSSLSALLPTSHCTSPILSEALIPQSTFFVIQMTRVCNTHFPSHQCLLLALTPTGQEARGWGFYPCARTTPGPSSSC